MLDDDLEPSKKVPKKDQKKKASTAPKPFIYAKKVKDPPIELKKTPAEVAKISAMHKEVIKTSVEATPFLHDHLPM